MKTIKKQLISILLCMALVLSIVATASVPASAGKKLTSGSTNSKVAYAKMKSKPLTITDVPVGAVLQIKPGLKGKIKWKTSKSSVVTVDKSGIAHFVGPGTATITAKQGKTKRTLKFKNVTAHKVESNYNIAAVSNKPTHDAIITITGAPSKILTLKTYHWNNGKGKKPGKISLVNIDTGETVGTWKALGTAGQGGVKNAEWHVVPYVTLQPGQYKVIDSDPDTWSHNSESKNWGFVEFSYEQ